MSVYPETTETGPVPAGSHACWIVEDAGAYAAAAAAFLAEAVTAGERPVVFAPAGAVPRPASRQPSPLTADPATEFLRGGPLDPAAMVSVLREQTALAKASGYRGLRLVADMDWIRPAYVEPSAVVAYETLLDRAVHELGATIICAYRRSSFSAEVLAGSLAVHSVLHGHDSDPQFRFISSAADEWRLSGEVDMTVRSLFEAAFGAAVGLGRCAVDLRELRFIDVGGMRAIADGARDEMVELRHAPPVFRRYWELCDFTSAAPGVRLVIA